MNSRLLRYTLIISLTASVQFFEVDTECGAYLIEDANFIACGGSVPLRQFPDMFAPRLVDIPEGVAVKVDVERGKWVRVIYRVPAGFHIGWALAVFLCPIEK